MGLGELETRQLNSRSGNCLGQVLWPSGWLRPPPISTDSVYKEEDQICPKALGLSMPQDCLPHLSVHGLVIRSHLTLREAEKYSTRLNVHVPSIPLGEKEHMAFGIELRLMGL